MNLITFPSLFDKSDEYWPRCRNMYFLSGFCLFFSFVLCAGQSEIGIRPNPLLHPQRSPESPIDCENDEQCQGWIENSTCIDKSCECSDNLLLSSDGSKCLEKVNEFGSSCEDHIQCSHELYSGGVCEDSSCTCKSGYHYLKGFCWKSSNLHEKCVKDEQCFSAYEYIGLECVEGVCRCREHYYERSNSSCRRERRTGESCNLDKDCIDGSTCERMKCSREEQDERPTENSESSSEATFRTMTSRSPCPKGMFELNGTCVLELGMNCKGDRDCTHIKNALCLDKSACACEPATFVASENNRECLRVTRGKVADIVSTSCKKDSQCGVFGEKSVCRNRRCACRSGSYWEKESGLCWQVRKLGESCVASEDCQPSQTKADCVKNVCQCPEGYHPHESVCVPDAVEPGDFCETDEECLFDNSFCDSFQTCACIDSYYPEKGKCVPGVESPCNTQKDCAHLKNTECRATNTTRKQCLCLDQHCMSEDYKYCLPIMNFGEECSESFQCTPRLGDLGECREDACQCREGAHFSFGKCYRSKFVGEKCSRLAECYPGNDTDSLLCLNGYCSCNYDYELDQSGICVRTNSGTALVYYSLSLVSSVILSALRR